MPKKRTNWHETAVCAIQITLRDYAHLLEYFPEYPLAKNAFRIDLLVIQKLLKEPIPLSIAHIFRSYNLWEIKGIHSSVTVYTYYKTLTYANLLIAADQKSPPYKRQEISLSFLCRKFPRTLIKHLTEECKKNIANSFPGVYYIDGDIFPVQIIVTGRLRQEEALYLRCLTDNLADSGLAEQLARDYAEHLEQTMYERYMNQLANANLAEKGEQPMAICCEGIFKLYGTSYQEVRDQAVAPVQAQLDQTTAELNIATSELHKSQDENERLRRLLDEHGIAYT